MQLLQSCFHFARSPSVVASLQRWAEGCNRVAVGTHLGLLDGFLLFLLDGSVGRLGDCFFLFLDRAVPLHLFALGMGQCPVTARCQKGQGEGRRRREECNLLCLHGLFFLCCSCFSVATSHRWLLTDILIEEGVCGHGVKPEVPPAWTVNTGLNDRRILKRRRRVTRATQFPRPVGATYSAPDGA